MGEQEMILQKLRDAVLEGDPDLASVVAKQSLQAGVDPLVAVEKGLSAGIREVGERFGRMEAFLPELVMSARAMEAAVTVLSPHFHGGSQVSKGKILIGSVKGDIHDIGKNIVSALLSVNGYEVTDIGRDVPSQDFIDKAIRLGSQIVGMSALLTTSLPMMREVLELMEEQGVRDRFKVIIGGGPTSLGYANTIKVDGYAATAHDGVVLCDNLLGVSR